MLFVAIVQKRSNFASFEATITLEAESYPEAINKLEAAGQLKNIYGIRLSTGQPLKEAEAAANVSEQIA